MAASITINITDPATPRLHTLSQLGQHIFPRIGAAVSRLAKDHLFERDQKPNKNGWPSQHFYSAAAKATTFRTDNESVTISINKQGFRLRYEGGTVKPVNVKYLTIPACAEAYGKRALEFGNLVMIFGKTRDGQGIRPVALAAGEGGATRKKFSGRDDSATERKIKGADAGKIMYWLVLSSTQKGDKTILPTEEEIQKCVSGALSDAVNALTK